ncbi:MAG TPA: lamin tail domain-containing protein [Kofleriaceae bacterium]|nr:lamin tail domain-containing protein [Kofleriaceae bacterium]
MTALLFCGGGGCDREPEPELCPPLAEGDLVVSEIRGEQTVKDMIVQMGDPPMPVEVDIPDPYGEWIELYNASGSSIDLYGLQLRFLELDGSNEGTVIVRRHLDVAAGERVVLSYFPDGDLPAHADYGWFPDFLGSDGQAHSLFDTGVVDVYACGTRIDRVRPDGLPSNATWSFPAEPPDVTANDESLTWCDDGTGATDTEYAAGTPGEVNRPCP